MATNNITLINGFINLHFNKVYDYICKGPKNIEQGWKIDASKKDVFVSINQFFHLCFNAGKIDEQHKVIEEWITALTKIACINRSHGVISSYKYRVLSSASEPITKFLFGCFDWPIDKINPKDPYNIKQLAEANASNNKHNTYPPKLNTHLDSFHWRLIFYKVHAHKYPNQTSSPIFRMKEKRNETAHTAIDFFSNRQKCLNELIDTLYNYIMIFYMIRSNCYKDLNDLSSRVKIKDDIKRQVNLPDFTNVEIAIECVDEISGKQIEGKEIKVYEVVDDKNEYKETQHEPAFPCRFKVAYFNSYIIKTKDNGRLSRPSEKLVIEHDFINGTVVRINVPPMGTPKPEKISISELILYSEKDLPDDVKFLLSEMERYADKDQFAKVARSLVLASATNNERDRDIYLKAVGYMRESMAAELAKDMPLNINDFIMSKLNEVQAKMIELYHEDSFSKLCESIDAVYDELGGFVSAYDSGVSTIEQIKKNVTDFINGEKISIGTKATDQIIKLHKEIANLQTILTLGVKYPEIIEAEFGKEWLNEQINDLFLDQILYCFESTNQLSESISNLCRYLIDHCDKETEAGKRSLVCSGLLFNFLNDLPVSMVRMVKMCCGLLLFWVDNCKVESDDHAEKLVETVRSELLSLFEDKGIHFPMTPLKNKVEVDKLAFAISSIKDNIKILSHRIITYHEYSDTIYKENLHDIKKTYGLMAFIVDGQHMPVGKRDIRSEILFASILKMFYSCNDNAILQLICNSPLTINHLSCLFACNELGISCTGLYGKWSDAHSEWVKGNQKILDDCWSTVRNIYDTFSSRKKIFESSGVFPTKYEVVDVKALQILDIQKQQITLNYVDEIPDYINKIIDTEEYILPNHIKIKLLENVIVPRELRTENLLYVIKAVQELPHVDSYAVSFLRSHYISGEYGKRILGEEAQKEFKSMPKESKMIFMDVLMNLSNPPFASTMPSTRFMLAYRMNFSENASHRPYIKEQQFFIMMSRFKMDKIWPYDVESFIDACSVFDLLDDYVKSHPNDEAVKNQATKGKALFFKTCKDYLKDHVEYGIIDQSEFPRTSFLRAFWQFIDQKGKSRIEQLVIKYEYLYDGYKKLPINAGWYEAEQKLFQDILSQIPLETTDVKEKICQRLWQTLYLSHIQQIIFDNVVADRMMAIQPHCSKEQFDSMIVNFYTHCSYGKIRLNIHDVVNGLEILKTLFRDYGQNIKVPFNGKSSSFVEILLKIHDMEIDRNN